MSDSVRYLKVNCEQTACPLYPKRNCVPAEIRFSSDQENPEVEIAYIGPPPTPNEGKTQRPFSDDANFAFRKALKVAGTSSKGHALLPVIRCSLPEGSGPEFEQIRKSAIQHCSTYLQRDLEQIAPKTLVVMGNDANQALNAEALKNNTPVKGSYGRVLRTQLGTKKYWSVLTFSPQNVFDHLVTMSFFVESLRKAKDITEKGNFSLYHPMRWKSSPEIHYCTTAEEVEDLVEFLLKGTNDKQVCAFDTETSGLNVRYDNKIAMLQFCVDPYEAWCVPYHYIHNTMDSSELERVHLAIKRLFTETPGFKYWVGHGVVFDILQIMEHFTDGKTIRNRPVLDTIGLVYLLDENRTDLGKPYELNFKLKTLAPELLGREVYDEETLVHRAGGSLSTLQPDKLSVYAANDVVNTILLYEYCREWAISQGYLRSMMKLAVHLFGSAWRVFSSLRRNGFFVDLKQLRLLASNQSPILLRMKEIEGLLKSFDSVKKTNARLAKEVNGNQKMLFGVPWVFDVNKPAHKANLFFEQLNLKPLYFGKDGPSMDGKFLEAHSSKHEEVSLIDEYVSLKKLATSYTGSLLAYLDPSFSKKDHSTDSRIRAAFSFTGTSTGRVSCFDPNIQQIPKANSPAKAEIKNMFAAQQSSGEAYTLAKSTPPDRVLLQVDARTSEVRIWALLSKDPLLIDVLNKGVQLRKEYIANPTAELKERAATEGDQHSNTAANMFKMPLNKVTKKERDAAKSIVFGLMFGRGVRAIAEQLKNDDIEEVKGLCDQFNGTYNAGVGWMFKKEAEGKDKLYVESDIGRRRRLFAHIADDKSFDWEHPVHGAVAEANRQARNSPIQSQSSDFSMMGTMLLLDYIEDYDLDWKLVNTVHDSCVLEIPTSALRDAVKVVNACFTVDLMEYVHNIWGLEFPVPLEVDFEVGVQWGNMLPWDGSEPELQKVEQWVSRGCLASENKKK